MAYPLNEYENDVYSNKFFVFTIFISVCFYFILYVSNINIILAVVCIDYYIFN